MESVLKALLNSSEGRAFFVVFSALAVLLALFIAGMVFWPSSKEGYSVRVELGAPVPYVDPASISSASPDLAPLESNDATSSPAVSLPVVSQPSSTPNRDRENTAERSTRRSPAPLATTGSRDMPATSTPEGSQARTEPVQRSAPSTGERQARPASVTPTATSTPFTVFRPRQIRLPSVAEAPRNDVDVSNEQEPVTAEDVQNRNAARDALRDIRPR